MLRTAEIIYEATAADRFDPLDLDTLKLENRLLEHGLASAKPIGYKGLQPGTVSIRQGNETVLARSTNNGDVFIVHGAATAGTSLERLIKKIAGKK